MLYHYVHKDLAVPVNSYRKRRMEYYEFFAGGGNWGLTAR